jgi:adenosyl cobinamide kinase/adenosyl cobinamide phosphate guanylyltransferase
MIIIFGDSLSGKSSMALGLVRDSSNVLYFALDRDKSLERKIKIKDNIQFKFIEDPFMIDIEMEIKKNGGLKSNITHIVIDTINFIKKSDTKVNYLKETISSLEYIESTYNIKVIAVFNTLRNIDKTTELILKYGENIQLIKTNDKRVKI